MDELCAVKVSFGGEKGKRGGEKHLTIRDGDGFLSWNTRLQFGS